MIISALNIPSLEIQTLPLLKMTLHLLNVIEF